LPISLYEISVPGFLQILDGAAGFLERGAAHCRDAGIDPAEIVETSIVADMRPFRFQVQQLAYHSIGAIEAVMSGTLFLPGQRPAHDYAGLQALIDETREGLRQIAPGQIDAREGTDMVFRVGDNERIFTAEGFLLSFSIPNFHFHATTAYGILRARGVPLGKLDYMGALRLKS